MVLLSLIHGRLSLHSTHGNDVVFLKMIFSVDESFFRTDSLIPKVLAVSKISESEPLSLHGVNFAGRHHVAAP